MLCCSEHRGRALLIFRELPNSSHGSLFFSAIQGFSPPHLPAHEHHQHEADAEPVLTHAGRLLLRVVAQWPRVCGESSGSVHSSGTAVRCGPFPLSQIYKATCQNNRSCPKAIVLTRYLILYKSVFPYRITVFVPQWVYLMISIVNKRGKVDWGEQTY